MMHSFEEKRKDMALLTRYAAHHWTTSDEKDGKCCNNQDAAGP